MWRSRAKWLGLILAFALVAAACGGDDDDAGQTTTTAGQTTTTTTEAATTTTTQAATTTTTEAQPTKPYGGEAIVADDQEPPTLNTFAPGGDNFIVSIIGRTWWAAASRVNGFTLELEPVIVTEHPTTANGGVVVNADGTMTVKYQIRDEAQWEDGTPISGDDFMFTYEVIMDPDLPIDKTIYEDIVPESIVVGPKTFEYTLSLPTVQYEFLFVPILPKHQVEGSDFINDWNDQAWFSAGPFKFDSWQKGERVVMVKNDNYWKTDEETGQQLPFLDRVIFQFIPETASIISAFEAREVDIIQPPPAAETIQKLQSLEGQGATVEGLNGPIWEHLNFQFGENRLTRNAGSYNEFLEYRQAVAHAIDKDKIVDDILLGQVEPLDSYVEAYSPTLSQSSWAQYDYDPAKAQAKIQELCARADTDCDANPPKAIFSTTSNNDARVTLSQLFISMFEDAGILYEAQLEDSSLFFGETLDFGNWDLGEWAWVGSPGFAGLIGIHDVWDPESPPPNGGNYYRWGTPEVTGADPDGFNQGPSSVIDDATARFAVVRDEMNATVDTDTLVTLLNEAESILADNAVIIPLYARLSVAAVWGDELAGFKHNPSTSSHTWNAEQWYRVDL